MKLAVHSYTDIYPDITIQNITYCDLMPHHLLMMEKYYKGLNSFINSREMQFLRQTVRNSILAEQRAIYKKINALKQKSPINGASLRQK